MKKIPFLQYIGHITLVLALWPLLTNTLSAQTTRLLTGIVTNEREELLIGATLHWKNTKTGVVTDTTGRFSIEAPLTEAILIVRYVGYADAEIQVLPAENNLWIEIKSTTELKEVTVSEHRFDNVISSLDPRNVESIGKRELRKAPCCNLSESFETNGAIDVAYSNALTGVKEIQLLGLRGIYGQFLVENRPTMGGIATPFAMEFVPGTWLEGIVLAKGASTVKNGFAGITGQINADLVKPQSDLPVFVNVFTSTEGRGEVNVHLNKKIQKYAANGLYLHSNYLKNNWDMNQDNFYDSPARRQVNAMYRYTYDGPAGCAQFNVQALSDRRSGGQIRPFAGNDAFFGIQQRNDRVEAWGKYGKEGVGKPYNQIGNIFGGSWHRYEAEFGPNAYSAEQASFYLQSLFQTIVSTTDHKVVLASSLQYDDIKETVNETNLDRREAVPGAMAEYTYSRPNLRMSIPDLVVVVGARVDWNSRFGWFFTPRISGKYHFSEKSTLRLSAGRGYRSPNLMAENISLLASNRAINFASDLGAEEAWNYGISYNREFKIAGRNANWNTEFYRTDFVRQIIPDVDQSPVAVSFYYAPGKSFSNSLLTVLQYNPFPGWDVKLSYKWNDVRATYSDNVLRTVPLVARHRGLVSLDYTTRNKKWMFNSHIRIVGPQRLPDNSQIPHELTHHFPEKSPVYATLNAQITRRWGKVEWYIGGENLTNFQQHHAIIAAERPDSPFFNGSQMWGPMMGTVGYMGVRFSPSGL
jgi:outer membrane receptor for ferrienterochelin and colicins